MDVKVAKNGTALALVVPVIDLSSAGSAGAIADACSRLGFFKAVNHGMAAGLVETLEAEAMSFFALPQGEKLTSAGGAGYGCRNGDVGSVEYLLLSTGPDDDSANPNSTIPMPASLCQALEEYMRRVQEVAGRVLELMAEGLGMEDTDVFSGMVHRRGSDETLRVNHCPPSLRQLEAAGFGEHTDPQIISLLRSNSVPGMQIALQDGTWHPVAPDPDSVFINVGDAMEVLTNGRYRSVRHRVVVAEELLSCSGWTPSRAGSARSSSSRARLARNSGEPVLPARLGPARSPGWLGELASWRADVYGGRREIRQRSRRRRRTTREGFHRAPRPRRLLLRPRRLLAPCPVVVYLRSPVVFNLRSLLLLPQRRLPNHRRDHGRPANSSSRLATGDRQRASGERLEEEGAAGRRGRRRTGEIFVWWVAAAGSGEQNNDRERTRDSE